MHQFLPGPSKAMSLVALARLVRCPVKFWEEYAHQYGPTFCLSILGGKHIAFTHDVDLIKIIFKEQPDIFGHASFHKDMLPIVGKQSVFAFDGEKQLRKRAWLMPHFLGERLQEFSHEMLDIAFTETLNWPCGQPFKLLDKSREVALVMIIKLIFGVKDGPFFLKIKNILEKMVSIVHRYPLLFTSLLQKDLGSWSPWGNFLKLQKQADLLIYSLIERKRAEQNVQENDVLTSLLRNCGNASPEAITDQEIRDHLMTLLLTGHETTSSQVLWLFLEILRHPSYQVRLEAEIEGCVLGGALSVEKILAAPFLDAVLKEVLRMYAVTLGTGRDLKDELIWKNYKFPQGTRIFISNYLAHRNPTIFENPYLFMPERFMHGTRFSPHEWFPFGGGRSRCLGMFFAMHEMKLIAAAAFHKFSIRLVPNQNTSIVRKGITIIPQDDLIVTVNSKRQECW